MGSGDEVWVWGSHHECTVDTLIIRRRAKDSPCQWISLPSLFPRLLEPNVFGTSKSMACGLARRLARWQASVRAMNE